MNAMGLPRTDLPRECAMGGVAQVPFQLAVVLAIGWSAARWLCI